MQKRTFGEGENTMTELQELIEKFGFGFSVEKLASIAYWEMKGKGHDVCIINDRYLEMDGTTYLFSKSKKHGRWIAKVIC